MNGPSLFIDDNFAKEISNDEVYVSNHLQTLPILFK